MRNLLLISIACLFISCEKELPAENLPFEKKLVLNSIIRPDTTITVFLSSSVSIVDHKTPEAVTGATVQLFEDDVLIGTLRDTTFVPPEEFSDIFQQELKGFYVLDYEPKIGRNYRLQVEHPDFTSVSATTEIPIPSSSFSVSLSEPKILSYNFDVGVDEPSLVEYIATIDIQDAPNENFYHIAVIGEYFNATRIDDELVNYYYLQETFYSSNDVVFDEVENPLLQDEDFFSFNWNRRVFDDKLFNNQAYDIEIVFQVPVGVAAASYFGDGSRTIDGVFRRFFVEVRSISEDLYQYNKTLSIQETIADDPFAEPVQIYSNIENGHGIFAGYNPELFEFSLAEFIPEE